MKNRKPRSEQTQNSKRSIEPSRSLPVLKESNDRLERLSRPKTRSFGKKDVEGKLTPNKIGKRRQGLMKQ